MNGFYFTIKETKGVNLYKVWF